MRNFRQYKIWQKAIELTDRVYSYTENFPKSEIYALSCQLQRAAVSIASNIAEDSSRTSEKDFAQFLEMFIGSAFEVETQLTIAQRRCYISEDVSLSEIEEIQYLEKQINIFIQS